MPEPDTPNFRRRQARRAVLTGVGVVAFCTLLILSPILLGRGSLNRYLVAFGLLGVFVGGSFVLHGSWDWLRAGRP
jgi:hypothetical protein